MYRTYDTHNSTPLGLSCNITVDITFQFDDAKMSQELAWATLEQFIATLQSARQQLAKNIEAIETES